MAKRQRLEWKSLDADRSQSPTHSAGRPFSDQQPGQRERQWISRFDPWLAGAGNQQQRAASCLSSLVLSLA